MLNLIVQEQNQHAKMSGKDHFGCDFNHIKKIKMRIRHEVPLKLVKDFKIAFFIIFSFAKAKYNTLGGEGRE